MVAKEIKEKQTEKYVQYKNLTIIFMSLVLKSFIKSHQ